MTLRRQQKATSGGAARACDSQSMSPASSTTDGTRTYCRMQEKLHEVHERLIIKFLKPRGPGDSAHQRQRQVIAMVGLS